MFKFMVGWAVVLCGISLMIEGVNVQSIIYMLCVSVPAGMVSWYYTSSKYTNPNHF